MDSGLALVIAAVVTTGGTILVALGQMFRRESAVARKENRDDHALVTEQLGIVYRIIRQDDDKLEKHIDHHREGKADGKTVRTTKK